MLFFSVIAAIELLILFKLVKYKLYYENTLLILITSICTIILSVFLLKTYNKPYIQIDDGFITIHDKGFKYKKFNISKSKFNIRYEYIEIISNQYEFGKIHLSLLENNDKVELINYLNSIGAIETWYLFSRK